MKRPKVTLLSHTYLAETYRGKLDSLAEDVELTLISPRTFPWSFAMKEAVFSGEEGYAVRTYPVVFPLGVQTSTRWILSSSDMGLRQASPDIIHVENETHSFSLMQALLYRRLYTPRAKVVVFVWANQKISGLKGLGLNGLSRLMLREIDFLIAGNTAGKALLLEDGVPESRLAVIPQIGIDRGAIVSKSGDEGVQLRRELGIGPDEFVIGYVGRFVPEKGITDVIDAVRQLRLRSPPLRLLCVGEGVLKERLMACRPDVVVASPGAGPQVTPFYRVMDALVLPSRTGTHWREQFGRVLIEAMAAGVPVIGSDSGAIPEVIGDAGAIVPERNVAKLTKALADIVSDADLRAEYAARGRARVRTHFANDVIARDIVKVYQQLV